MTGKVRTPSSDERDLLGGRVVILATPGGRLDRAPHSGRGLEQPEEVRTGQDQEKRGHEGAGAVRLL